MAIGNFDGVHRGHREVIRVAAEHARALGRALGETMAVALVLSSGALTASLIQSGNQTIAAEIALNFPEASGLKVSTLIAAGLVLFIMTLVLNLIAGRFVGRVRQRY